MFKRLILIKNYMRTILQTCFKNHTLAVVTYKIINFYPYRPYQNNFILFLHFFYYLTNKRIY